MIRKIVTSGSFVPKDGYWFTKPLKKPKRPAKKKKQ